MIVMLDNGGGGGDDDANDMFVGIVILYDDITGRIEDFILLLALAWVNA